MAMEMCQYSAVASEIKEAGLEKEVRHNSWKPFLRQLLVITGILTIYFTNGLCLGAPTIFIPQLRKAANFSEAVSDEMAAWLSSVLGYAAIPWVIILPIMLVYIGRKNTFTFVSFCMIGIFMSYILSETPTHLLITQVFQGIPHATCMSIALVTAVEYSSTKYRGSFLNLKAPSFYWGVWVSNAIGTYFPWKYFAYLGFLTSLYTLTVFAWPKSPFWLATKGRYEECRKSHRWLKATDELTEKELEDIIKSQVEHRRRKETNREQKVLRNFWNMIKSKEFYKPVLMSSVLMAAYVLSGKQACNMYAIDIIKDITDSEATAYNGMLILDGVTVLIMYVGSCVSGYVRRRTLLFGFGALSIFFLLMLSLHCYLIKMSIVESNKYITISLLIGFSVAVGLGPFLMTTSVYAEMLPSNYKSESIAIVSIVFSMLQSTMFKVSPSIFRNWGMHGAFLFYGTSMGICLIGLYKHLPETKDLTLLEIQDCLKGTKGNTEALL